MHSMDLVGQAIYLRLMTTKDTDNIVKWRNEDFVRRKFIYQKPFTRQGHEEWIRTMIDTGRVVQFVICEKHSDRAVGSVYLRDIDTAFHKAEYGIFIGEKDALGRGYGTEAAKLMLTYAFDELKLHKVMLRVLADNMQALHSYEKAGFVKEAYLKDEVFLEGNYRDVIYMAAISDEGERNLMKQAKGGI